VPNEEIEEYIGTAGRSTSDLKAITLANCGIKTRHYAIDKDQRTVISNAAMAAGAVRVAAERADLGPDEVELLCAATTIADVMAPGQASMVQGELGYGPLEIASLHGVCSSGMMALKNAYLQVAIGEKRNAISVASELASRWFKSSRYEQMGANAEEGTLPLEAAFLRYMLSDGAGAVVIESEPKPTGGFAMSPIGETSATDFIAQFRLNALSCFLCSAAAVAARLVPAATATDTGGSIRQPAALCGVTGVKPTYGRVSRYGMIAFASSLDQGGVIAITAADAALILREMSGFDPNDSTSVDMPVPDYLATLDAPLAGLKIGLLKEFFDKGLDAENEKRIREALTIYERLGATLREVSLPNLPLSVPAYYVVAPAECSSNLARFDGVRFGHRAKDPRDLMDLYKRSRGEGFGAEVKRRIMTGTYVLSAGYYDAYYLKAQKVRQLITSDFTRAFGEVDVLIGPTTPTAAFEIGAKTSDPITMYLNDIYTIGANLAGLPAMSIPCGFTQGLPVGLQIIGPHFSEAKLLNVAHLYQRETDWHTRVPERYT